MTHECAIFFPIFFFPVNMRRCVTSLGYSSLAWVQAEDGVNAGCHSRAEQDEITNQKIIFFDSFIPVDCLCTRVLLIADRLLKRLQPT